MIYYDAWAKLVEQVGALPLIAHSGDVAAVLGTLLDEPAWIGRLSRAAGRSLTEADVARLCALAFLHDLGKANRGFWQRQFPNAARVGHTAETAALFLVDSVAAAPEARRLDGLLDSWGVDQLFYAIMAHHGRPLEIYARSSAVARRNLRDDRKAAEHWTRHDDYAPLVQLGRLLDAAERRFLLAYSDAPPLPNEPAFVSLFCGLLTLADWLGSDASLFPLAEPQGEPRAAMQFCAAVRAVEGRGLGALPTPSCSFAEAFTVTPRGMQHAAADLALGPIALLEAETGSGKTEAALWRWLALRQAGLVDGLYFALPTRSAAVQLHSRIQTVLNRVFPSPSPQAVLAVPGYLRAGDEEGQALPDFGVAWSSETENDGRWAAERPKRFLAARIAVGTIDQVLMAGLQVKHAHLRASCLSRSLLVVDEVHSSSAFMCRVLQQVLSNHRAVGGHALLLSATLGADARARLLGQQNIPSLAAACATPYPALCGTDRAPQSASRQPDSAKHVTLEAWTCIDDANAIARRAIEAARAGASVLVVRNSVAGAIAVARAVEALAPELAFRAEGVATLHHGRFSPDDRRLLDRAVETAFGKGRDHHGQVLCGTQTLEQSLDLDADLLVTDLAPMDVLLQRIGRLHRHERSDRGPFSAARAVVLTPAARDLSGLLDHARHGLGPRRDGTGAYPDVLVLEATLRLIEANRTIEIPADNRRLVEGALHPEVLDNLAGELGTQWFNHAAQQAGSHVAERQLAARWALDLSAPFDTLVFPDKDEAIATRLGLRDRLFDFDPPFAGPFGHPVRRLTIPGWKAQSIPMVAEATVEGSNEAGTRLRIESAHFLYGRMGLEFAPA
jgi:CRISPR-associated endonuclease/helicase Cas3